MHNNIAIIHNYPPITGKALLLSLFFIFGLNIFNGCIRKRIDHAVAGAGTNNEIVSKGNDFFQVYQNDIFTLFIFKGVHDFASKFKCVQVSPHKYCAGRIDNTSVRCKCPTYFDNGAENNFV
jgi:hypothetical protein